LIQLAAIFALAVGVASTSPPGIVQAIVFIALFLVVFAYDVPFELLNGGRTAGKMAAGIRVVGVGGEPVSFFASMIRNIVRIADILPGVYLVGATAILATERDQRLGDLAAGTIVVRDKFPGLPAGAAAPITVPADAVATWDVSALDNDDVATIRYFLDRRLTLPWSVRSYFAVALASRVAP